MLFLLVDPCQVKLSLMSRFFLGIASLLPSSPAHFNFQFLISQISLNSPWGTGGIIIELLSGVVDYLRLVVAWKFVKLLINVLGSKL
jgi:hypothetical protein